MTNCDSKLRDSAEIILITIGKSWICHWYFQPTITVSQILTFLLLLLCPRLQLSVKDFSFGLAIHFSSRSPVLCFEESVLSCDSLSLKKSLSLFCRSCSFHARRCFSFVRRKCFPFLIRWSSWHRWWTPTFSWFTPAGWNQLAQNFLMTLNFSVCCHDLSINNGRWHPCFILYQTPATISK